MQVEWICPRTAPIRHRPAAGLPYTDPTRQPLNLPCFRVRFQKVSLSRRRDIVRRVCGWGEVVDSFTTTAPLLAALTTLTAETAEHFLRPFRDKGSLWGFTHIA